MVNSVQSFFVFPASIHRFRFEDHPGPFVCLYCTTEGVHYNHCVSTSVVSYETAHNS